MTPTPTGIAASWPVQYYDDRGQFFIWHTAPGVIVTQSRVDVINMVFARRIVRSIDAIRAHRADEGRALGGFAILHDWLSISRYEGPARREINRAWEKNVKPGDLRLVATQAQLNPIIRMAFKVISLSARALKNEDNRLVKDLGPIIKELGLVTPRADERLDEVRTALAGYDDSVAV